MSLKDFRQKWSIEVWFASVAHPQTNGQVEAANKSIMKALMKKLDGKKGKWAKEIPSMLCSYCTAYKEATVEMPFQMAYGVKAVISLERQTSSLRLEHFDKKKNDEGFCLCLNQINKVHNMALMQIVTHSRPLQGSIVSKSRRNTT